MQLYKKRIRNLEQQTPLFAYPYQIIPISRDGEFALEDKQLTGEYVFQFDDPGESETQEIEIVKDGAVRHLAFQKVPGVRHRDQTSKGYIINLKGRGNRVKSRLEVGIDYEIIVGEKIILEPVKKLTFDDIKTLN